MDDTRLVNEQTIERFIAGEPWKGSSDEIHIVEVPAGSYGRLRLVAADPFSDDEVATLREFADAVALGYARYLDIRAIQDATERKSAFLASIAPSGRRSKEVIDPLGALTDSIRPAASRANWSQPSGVSIETTRPGSSWWICWRQRSKSVQVKRPFGS